MKNKTILQLIDALGWNDFVNEVKNILKRLTAVVNTGQKDVIGDIVLDDSYNNTIVKVKASARIKIPLNLMDEFSCVFRTYSGATARFVNVEAVTMDAPRGKTLTAFKMATLFKDGKKETFILEGELE